MSCDTLISFKDIDSRFDSVRTGDIAITTRDDAAGLFITYFTFSLYQHTAIFAWVDRDKYNENKSINFISHNRGDDMLTFVHITKRRMYDLYTKEKRSGLVLCSLDTYTRYNLITVWNRPLSKYISDDDALNGLTTFMRDNSLVLEYENDIRTMVGVILNVTYKPRQHLQHRMICTTMICFYLESSYGYPFLINDPNDREDEYEVDFILPNHKYTVYKAKDFKHCNNQSPVLSKDEEYIVYGSSRRSVNLSTFHPFILSMLIVLVLLIVVLLLLLLFTKSNIVDTPPLV
jgi:hypothetical protein